MANYTVVLNDQEAERIARLTKVFGGSVGGFAAALVRQVSRLDASRVMKLHRFIEQLAQQQEEDDLLAAATPHPPAVSPPDTEKKKS